MPNTPSKVEKQQVLIITFANTTQAMTMEEKCQAYHLPGELIPVPRAIKASCGLAWRTVPEQKEILSQMMKKERIKAEKVVLYPMK